METFPFQVVISDFWLSPNCNIDEYVLCKLDLYSMIAGIFAWIFIDYLTYLSELNTIHITVIIELPDS